VAMPSKGRAGTTTTDRYMPGVVAFVPANEEIDYRRTLRCAEIVAVPDEVRGITRTRNWILDWADDPWVVFVDDDVVIAGYFLLGYDKAKKLKIAAAVLVEEWGRLFEIAEDMSYRIWGVDTNGALWSVRPYRPFIWQTYVTASCMGIRNETGIRFDETFPVKEDYEMTLRCIREDGGVVGARYLFWVNEHWRKAGGCTSYRTQKMEADAITRLMEMYPGLIRQIKRGGSGYSISLGFGGWS